MEEISSNAKQLEMKMLIANLSEYTYILTGQIQVYFLADVSINLLDIASSLFSRVKRIR